MAGLDTREAERGERPRADIGDDAGAERARVHPMRAPPVHLLCQRFGEQCQRVLDVRVACGERADRGAVGGGARPFEMLRKDFEASHRLAGAEEGADGHRAQPHGEFIAVVGHRSQRGAAVCAHAARAQLLDQRSEETRLKIAQKYSGTHAGLSEEELVNLIRLVSDAVSYRRMELEVLYDRQPVDDSYQRFTRGVIAMARQMITDRIRLGAANGHAASSEHVGQRLGSSTPTSTSLPR